MNLKFFVNLVIAIAMFSVAILDGQSAVAGHGEGNGGDICEDRFKIVRDDISTWISRQGDRGLRLPAEMDYSRYEFKIRYSISNAGIGCTDQVILAGGQQKTCSNFIDVRGKMQILCNSRRFMNTSESDQYVLVHHEYAGLAGFETNNTDGSNYFISNQLSGFLENQIVKKLAIKPLHVAPSNQNYDRLLTSALPQGSILELDINSVLIPNRQSLVIAKNHTMVCKLIFWGNSSEARIIQGHLIVTLMGSLNRYSTEVPENGFIFDTETSVDGFYLGNQQIGLSCYKNGEAAGTVRELRNLFESIGGSLTTPEPRPFD